jgi:hypothetical protein
MMMMQNKQHGDRCSTGEVSFRASVFDLSARLELLPTRSHVNFPLRTIMTRTGGLILHWARNAASPLQGESQQHHASLKKTRSIRILASPLSWQFA